MVTTCRNTSKLRHRQPEHLAARPPAHNGPTRALPGFVPPFCHRPKRARFQSWRPSGIFFCLDSWRSLLFVNIFSIAEVQGLASNKRHNHQGFEHILRTRRGGDTPNTCALGRRGAWRKMTSFSAGLSMDEAQEQSPVMLPPYPMDSYRTDLFFRAERFSALLLCSADRCDGAGYCSWPPGAAFRHSLRHTRK